MKKLRLSSPAGVKAPEVLSAKQMLRKLGNKVEKFQDGGSVSSNLLPHVQQYADIAKEALAGFRGEAVNPEIAQGLRRMRQRALAQQAAQQAAQQSPPPVAIAPSPAPVVPNPVVTPAPAPEPAPAPVTSYPRVFTPKGEYLPTEENRWWFENLKKATDQQASKPPPAQVAPPPPAQVAPPPPAQVTTPVEPVAPPPPSVPVPRVPTPLFGPRTAASDADFFALQPSAPRLPGLTPGTVGLPYNPFEYIRGPSALDLLRSSPNLSPVMLGGLSNVGYRTDRFGNIIMDPGRNVIRAFSEGGFAENLAKVNEFNVSQEDEEPIGVSRQMLQGVPQKRVDYSVSPTGASVRKTSQTTMQSPSGAAKGMKFELEQLSASKVPGVEGKLGESVKSQMEALAEEYRLKRNAAIESSRGLLQSTLSRPTLERPLLSKRGLTKKRFQAGGEVMSPEEQPVVEESKASQALKELIRPVREGVKGYFGMDPESSGSEAYRTGQALSNMPGAGAPATLGIFIGKSSKLWNKAMNEAARKMEKSGAPPEDIWQKTGNFKGPDNQWRQEISDLGAAQRMQVSQGPASMVLQHPELYQNYPDMKDILIRTDPYVVRSSYIGAGVPGAEEISLGTAGGKLENIRGLLHEMQHGIQFREGFGLGGSKITAFNDPKAFEILEMVRKRVSTPATLEEFAKGAYQTTKITPKIEDAYKNIYLKNYAANLKSGGLDRMAQEEAARIYYNRLLGETEARAVEDRRMFTPEQRLEVFPTKSYKVDGKPVALEDLIIKQPMERAEGGPVNKHDAFIKAHA